VQIQVEDTTSNTNTYTANNPYFYRTQITILQSKPILFEMENRLNLSEAWDMDDEELLRILQKSIQIDQIPNTPNLIITVKRPDSNEAAMIANELVGTYRDSLLDSLLKRQQRIRDKLKEVLDEQQARVDAAENEVELVRGQLDISEDGRRAPEGIEVIFLQQLETDRFAAQKDMTEKKAQLAALEGATTEGVTEDSSPVEFDPLMIKLIQQIGELTRWLKLEDIQEGVIHPDVKKYRLQKEKIEAIIGERIDVLRERLATDCKLAQARIEQLDKTMADIQMRTQPFNDPKYKSYRMAMANLESEQFIYKHLKARVQTELIQLEKEPRNPVTILEIAIPGKEE
jgi:uncharacterized protein involved in exopolysaccharide biosynthesis